MTARRINGLRVDCALIAEIPRRPGARKFVDSPNRKRSSRVICGFGDLSYVVVREAARERELNDLRGTCFAINEADSNSG